MADETTPTPDASGGFGSKLLTVLQAVGHGIGGMLGEVRAAREKQQQRLYEIGKANPDLLQVPEIGKAFQKSLGLTDEGFSGFKAHASVTNLAGQLAKTLGIPTTEAAPQDEYDKRAAAASPESAAAIAARPMVPRPAADIVKEAASKLPTGGKVSAGPKGTHLSLENPATSGAATGYSKLLNERETAVVEGNYTRAAELQKHIDAINLTPAQRTAQTETAKLDPALVAGKLNAKEQESLKKIAPASTIKSLQTADGKDVAPGSLTNEQVLTMTRGGQLVPKKTMTDKVLEQLWGKLVGGNNPFTGETAAAPGAPAAQPVDEKIDQLRKELKLDPTPK